MAGVRDDRLAHARQLLQAGREEFRRAQQVRGGAAVTGLRNACGKGWLAVLEAGNAYFMRQGVAEEELPDTDRGRRYFSRKHMDRDLGREFLALRQTFHIDGYYEGIVEFEDMPGYFEVLEEFVDLVEAAGSSGGQEG